MNGYIYNIFTTFQPSFHSTKNWKKKLPGKFQVKFKLQGMINWVNLNMKNLLAVLQYLQKLDIELFQLGSIEFLSVQVNNNADVLMAWKPKLMMVFLLEVI